MIEFKVMVTGAATAVGAGVVGGAGGASTAGVGAEGSMVSGCGGG